MKRDFDNSPNFSTALRVNESAVGIKRAIKALFEGQCKVALLYFAEHGTSAEDESGIVGVNNALVSFSYIMPHVTKPKHRHNILIFDSCFSAEAGHSISNYENAASIPSSVTILSAYRKNEPSASYHAMM